MPPGIPTEADFASLATQLPHQLHFPSPRESTTAFLVLFHGLGDCEAPFANFARAVALPGVLNVAVRGTAPLPGAALLMDADDGAGHFHWGDDVGIDSKTGALDADPGFTRAVAAVGQGLVRDVIVERCGWDVGDVVLFGFGQGGSLALALALQQGEAFKGVVSIGGPLAPSTVPTTTTTAKSTTPVLAVQLDDDDVEAIEAQFSHVTPVRWRRPDVAMPRDRDEMLPIMRFLADCLRTV